MKQFCPTEVNAPLKSSLNENCRSGPVADSRKLQHIMTKPPATQTKKHKVIAGGLGQVSFLLFCGPPAYPDTRKKTTSTVTEIYILIATYRGCV